MKKYIYVYNYFKELIISGQLKKGDKMPSIRKASEMLTLSKTTVESAYFELQADGYIIPKTKSGYYVTYNKNNEKVTDTREEKSNVKYDLKSASTDTESFDLNLWHRYIKSALRRTERFLSYSEVEGEEDLREALSDYIREKRNVTASPDRIIVGAGVFPLLNILCSLVNEKKTVSFPDSSFYQGMKQFEDFGFEVHTRDKDADIIYVSPSHMTSYGDVMPITRRLELVQYSQKKNSLVIEDDYDSDFMYQTKPTPSLFALSGGDNVIYMGSFSNVLTPAIRISFMVLTKDLAKKFKENRNRFAQTASKTEQIALCSYIRDKKINTQIRKISRRYINKTKAFYEEAKKELKNTEVSISENGLQIMVKCYFNKSPDLFEKSGILLNIKEYHNNFITLVLIPSALENSEFSGAISEIKKIIED